MIERAELLHQLVQALALMAFDLGWPGARFVRHFQPVHGRQLFDGFDKLEPVVIHQKVDGVAVRTTPKTVIKLLFAINGK